MTPLERVAKAIWENEYPAIPWEKADEAFVRVPYRKIARAALLELSAINLPDRMYSDSGFINTGGKAVRNLFSTTLRAIAAESQ